MAYPNPLPLELSERIPQEIFNEVATFADPVSLKSLSLVSHLWEASTRHLLFYEFQINERFLYWFSKNPEGWQRILPCIQRAHIALHFGIPERDALLKEGLSAALPRMVKLRQLRFEQGGSKAILLLIALLKGSEQITGLEIRDGAFESFQVLQGTVASLPGLEDLLVKDIWWPKDGERNEGSAQAMVPAPRKIINLTIDTMDSRYPTRGRTTSQILSWLAHGNVDSIRFMSVVEVDGSGVLSKFTRVETLILGYRWSTYDLGMKTLSAFKALKILEIRSVISLDLSGLSDIDHTWYSDLLSTVASPLSYLTFKLAFYGEDDLERMDWMTLNSLLQNSPFYAELSGIVIGFMRPHWPERPPSQADCDRMIRRRIPGLRPGARLTVEFYASGHWSPASSFIYD